MKDRMILIGVDWGASNFRGWAFNEEGDVIGGISVPDGVLTHSGDAMERLKFHITEWLGEWTQVPMIACGGAGSSPGILRNKLFACADDDFGPDKTSGPNECPPFAGRP